jgi:hypothetical protein
LALWDESVTRYDEMITSVRGDALPGRGKGGDDASWVGANFTRSKIKKIHAIESSATNEWYRFKATMR